MNTALADLIALAANAAVVKSVGRIFDHAWRDEKEHASCVRCHKIVTWRQLSLERRRG